MKVLMLGWEFPPHISGGLGTACAGLAQALERQPVDVLFVVPRLHGDESAARTAFIDASSIPIRQKQTITKDVHPVSTSEDPTSTSPATDDEPVPGKRTTIAVSSFLSPYTSTATGTTRSIEDWNYTFPTRMQATPRASYSGGKINARYVKEPYAFSGTYGSNLLEEVERYAQVVTEIARRHTFDVIHAHDWMTFRAGMEARRISGKPLVVHVHATEIDRSGAHANKAIFDIEKRGMTEAERVVTVSLWTKNIAVERYGIPAKKVTVIHNGISPKMPQEPSATSPPFGARIVTFLGRITHQKGPMYFVEAARKVHEQFPDTHFVVAGSGDQLPLMIERIAQLRLSERFHFTGFLRGPDIDRIWAMSSIYVMPSVSEPFGIAPLEAIQAGVPVIISKQAGVSEVMPHAIKVDFWDSGALAEAICNVLRFKSLANTLKKNGAEEIKHITWDKAAQKLTTLYYELCFMHEQEEPGPVLPGTPTEKTAQPAVL